MTISRNQHDLATKRVAEAGVSDRVEVRLQDYRDIADGPYDVVSSIGMFEHVGLARLSEYFERIHSLLRPGGRLLNHAIARPAHMVKGRGRKGTKASPFIDRYVFPDGELHELGAVVSAMQHTGFEVRHVESLREHYALDAATMGREPRGGVGRGGRGGRQRSRPGVAPLPRRIGAGVRGRPRPRSTRSSRRRRPTA